jgi:hypothetical protein
MKYSIIWITFLLLLTASKCNTQKITTDKEFFNYVIDGNYDIAYNLLDTNIIFAESGRTRDKIYSQLKSINLELANSEILYKPLDTFMLGDLHGITAQFMPNDSTIQFGLDVRYILEKKVVVDFRFSDNELWQLKNRKKGDKIDASKFVRPN